MISHMQYLSWTKCAKSRYIGTSCLGFVQKGLMYTSSPIVKNSYNRIDKGVYKLDGYKLPDEHRKKMTKGGVVVYAMKGFDITYISRKVLYIFDAGLFESSFVNSLLLILLLKVPQYMDMGLVMGK